MPTGEASKQPTNPALYAHAINCQTESHLDSLPPSRRLLTLSLSFPSNPIIRARNARLGP